MRKPWKAWIGVATLLGAMVAMPLTAQQTAKEAETEAGNEAQYNKVLKPADKREVLGRFVGTWKSDFKVMLYGNQEGTMKQDLEAHWILNDNFVEANFSQELQGLVVHGKIFFGFNGASGNFFQIFLTDKDPRSSDAQGVLLRSKNALVFQSTDHDPISGDSYARRDVYTFVDKDKIQYEQVFTFLDGSEIKPIIGYWTRVKDKP